MITARAVGGKPRCAYSDTKSSAPRKSERDERGSLARSGKQPVQEPRSSDGRASIFNVPL
eukprot:634319-Amphidinium_carterae.1